MGEYLEDKIREIVNTLLKGFDEEFTLKRLEVKDKGRVGLVRVFVDKPDGITIDDCAKISKELSVQLDIADPMKGPFRLEVSSPGISNEEES